MDVENNTTATAPARPAKPVYEALAGYILQRKNCIAHNNTEWLEKSTQRILDIVENYLPSGSGVDSGTKIDLDKSTEDKLVFQADFHHMDDTGSYAGWTEHTITVRPSLFDKFTVTVSGRNRSEIKDHLAELFYFALREDVRED